jgi:D-sedoheptulose 7-phosphate isomerase
MRSYADSRASLSATAYLSELARILPLVPQQALAEAINVLLEARARGRHVYVIGNGGSASTASHMVCDLVKSAALPGFAPLKAFTLADNTALLTAWANDRSYERIFAEQVAGLVEPGDVLIAISASGNSPNIVAALATANNLGAQTIGLLGFEGGAALELVDVAIHIPCADYGLVEDTHAAIGHAMSTAIRRTLELEAAQPVFAGAAD